MDVFWEWEIHKDSAKSNTKEEAAASLFSFFLALAEKE